MASQQAEAILARFPGPVTLVPSRLRLLIGLLLMLGLTTFCVLVLIPKTPDAGGYDTIMTALSTVVLGGLTVRTAILLLWPGTLGLTLHADGFEVMGFFRRVRTPWRATTGFRVEQPDDDRLPPRVVYDVPTAGRRGAAKAALPINYPISNDDLAWLMTQWRERALQHGHHSVVPLVAAAGRQQT